MFSANNIKVSIDSSRNAFEIPPVDLNSEAYAFVDPSADDEGNEVANLKTLRKAKESSQKLSLKFRSTGLKSAQSKVDWNSPAHN